MTKRLDAADLRQAAVNPLAEEPQRRVLVLNWAIDPRTQRPVGYWRLETKMPFDPSLSRWIPDNGCAEVGDVTHFLKIRRQGLR